MVLDIPVVLSCIIHGTGYSSQFVTSVVSRDKYSGTVKVFVINGAGYSGTVMSCIMHGTGYSSQFVTSVVSRDKYAGTVTVCF